MWHSGICKTDDAYHGLTLAFFALTFVAALSCNPFVARFLPWLLLVQGALLVVESVGPHVPGAEVMSMQTLLAVDCLDQSAFNTAIAWVLLTACVAAVHWFLLEDTTKDGVENKALVGPLLSMGAAAAAHQEGQNESGYDCPDKDQALSRHAVLCHAISAPPGADLSHLTDHERKLVDICRTDEDEKNRILWGGGLY